MAACRILDNSKNSMLLSSSLTTLDVDAKNDGSSFCRRGASRLVNCQGYGSGPQPLAI